MSQLRLEPAVLVGGEKILAHSKKACQGDTCSVHNPSQHHMASWPQHWREDSGMMERICSHGIGHPDPDHQEFIRRTSPDRSDSVHGCDGCCDPRKGSP